MSSPDARLSELQLELPPAPTPQGVYKPCLIVDRFVYVSGHGPYRTDGRVITGIVGRDLTEAEGKAAARQVGLGILATLRAHLGTLDRIERVVKVLGMVAATPDFERHPAVINGCSELFADVWGAEHGIGVRSAVGMGSLPSGIPVEIEAMFALVP
jgi:enamine deaminase RidA (YjgF/YER057c/UK114 family)